MSVGNQYHLPQIEDTSRNEHSENHVRKYCRLPTAPSLRLVSLRQRGIGRAGQPGRRAEHLAKLRRTEEPLKGKGFLPRSPAPPAAAWVTCLEPTHLHGPRSLEMGRSGPKNRSHGFLRV